MPSVLFVCHANLCRSPAAAALLKEMAKEKNLKDLSVDSCGISDSFIQRPPHPFLIQCFKKRGIILEGKAKVFKLSYFDHYDLILSVNEEILSVLKYRAKEEKQAQKLHLLTDFSLLHHGTEIEDPIAQGQAGFENMLTLLEQCLDGLLDFLYPKKG